MNKLNSKHILTPVLAAALLAGCGGGGGGGVAAVDPATEVGQSVMKTLAFIQNLIANNGENSDPIDINPITLAVDDSAEPTSLE